MKALTTLFVLTTVAVAVSQAASISIILDDPSQTGSPGDTLHFLGTITNIDTNAGDSPFFLNLDSLNLALSDAVPNDLFLANVPIDLAEGASSGDIELFDYTLANPEADPFGSYLGAYALLGGMDGGAGTAQDILAQVNFSVTVEPAVSPTPTPEPSTFALAGVALLFAGWLDHRRRDKLAMAAKVA
jgi:PEP-CTERM motif